MTDTTMADGKGRHGVFAAVVIVAYDDPRLARLAQIRAEVDHLAKTLGTWFAGDGQNLVGDGRSPTVRHLLNAWQPSARRALVYWAGHGKPEGPDEFYLYCRDTVDHPGPGNAISAVELGVLLADKQVDAVVLVVDLCHTGGGAREIFTAFDKRIEPRAYPPGRRPRLAVISAAQRYQQAHEAVFARTLVKVLKHGPPPATESYWPWGEHDAYLTPAELTEAVAEQLRQDRVDQEPDCKGTMVTNFFPNPRHVAFSPDMEVEAKRRRRALLPADVREHFMLKFRGIDTLDEHGWYFTGRTQPLRQIVAWLRSADSGLLVVTGPPGCGKSAVLGRLAVLSDAGYRSQAPKARLRPDTDPGVGAITAGIHAKNKTLLDCVGELAEALGLPTPPAGWQSAAELTIAVQTKNLPVTLLLDALDEARPADQTAIARDLLQQLASLTQVRVLVGTRPDRAQTDPPPPNRDGSDGPLLRALAADQVVRLDRDPKVGAAVAAYVRQRLRAVPGSPYKDAPEHRDKAAKAIAARSQGIFLFGRLLARALTRRREILDLASEEAEQLLRGGVSEAFAADLARYGRAGRQRVRDLLAPLAWADGAGLPRRQVWLALANALTGKRKQRRYEEADLAWLLEHAGAHLIEAGEDGQTVYRLYHQAFNDYLRHGHNQKTVQGLITDALLALVGPEGARDWPNTNPYLHRHLATHAAAAGRLADLIDDSRYLLYADPQQLARVLGAVDYRQHVLARLYWRALDRLRDVTPVERAAVLHATALDDEPAVLPLLHTEAELPWRGLWASSPPTPFHRRLTGHTGEVNAVAVGQVGDRSVIVSGGDDQTVRVWDAQSGEPQAVLTGHSGPVRGVAVGQVEGRTVIVSGGDDQTVRVWDAQSGEPPAVLTGHAGWVRGVAVGQVGDRAMIVSGGDDRKVQVWDWDARERVWRRRQKRRAVHTGPVNAVAVGQVEGRIVIMSGSDDQTVQVWDANSGQPPAVLTGHTDWVTAVALGQLDDRTVIVSGSDDQTVRVWDAQSSEPQAVLTGHTGPVRGVAVGQVGDRTVIVSGSDDQTVRVWDARSGDAQAVLSGHSGPVRGVAVGQVGDRTVIVSGSRDQTVRVWDAQSSEPQAVPPGHSGPVRGVAVGRLDGRAVIVSGSDDQTVRVWDAQSGDAQAVLTGHSGPVRGVAVGQVGGRTMIVSGSDDQTVRVWDAQSGDPWGILTGHSGPVRGVAVGQVGDRTVIVSGSDDRSDDQMVRMWDSRRGAWRRRRRAVHSGPVHAVAVGQLDGRTLIVSGSDDQTVRVWDAQSGDPWGPLTGHTGPVNAVAVGQVGDRTVIVSGGDDQTVRVWDAKSGQPWGALSGHTGPVRGVAVGQVGDRSVIVSGGDDQTVRVWDAQSGEPQAALTGHSGPVRGVAVGEVGDRTVIVSGSGSSVQVVQLSRLGE